MSGAERALRVEGELMPRRLWVLGLGLGLVMTMLGAGSASAAPKKRPDLVVSAVSVSPGKVVAGGVLKVSDTTRNKGRKKAKRSVTRYALSANKKWDKKDVVLGSRVVKALKPGKKHAVKARSARVAAATRPGTYWLLACADAKKKVRESNERNNCRVAKRRVTVTRRNAAAPPDDAVKVKVNVRGHVDWKDRTRLSVGSVTTEIDSAATFDFNVPAELTYLQGRPFYLEVTWDKGTVSGRTVYKRVNNDACRVTSTADQRVAGEPALLSQVLVHLPVPGRPSLFGQFSLNFVAQSTTPVTAVDCRGETWAQSPMRFAIVDTPDELASVSANADLSRIVLKGGGAPRTHPGRTWEATVTLDITHPR